MLSVRRERGRSGVGRCAEPVDADLVTKHRYGEVKVVLCDGRGRDVRGGGRFLEVGRASGESVTESEQRHENVSDTEDEGVGERKTCQGREGV